MDLNTAGCSLDQVGGLMRALAVQAAAYFSLDLIAGWIESRRVKE